MALQVWLPLNENLRNQGLSNASATSYNSTIVDYGKTGSCFQYNGLSGSYLDTGWGQGESARNISVCLWIKPLVSMNRLMALSTSSASDSANKRLYIGAADNTWDFAYGANAWASQTDIPVKVDEWQHLCLTIDSSGTARLYFNGEETSRVKQYSVDFNLLSNIFIAGRDTTFNLNCQVNDVRIYNHCLSLKEIKDILKTLILHYTFDDPLITLSKYTSVMWNQKINALGNNPSIAYLDTSVTTERHYIVTETQVSTTRIIATTGGSTIPPEHKAFVKLRFRSNFTNTPYLRYQYDTGLYRSLYCMDYIKNQWCEITGITNGFVISGVTGVLSTSNEYIKDEYFSIPIQGGLMSFDLTEMFGSGNEPTLEECKTIFCGNYYPYDTGTQKILSQPVYDASGYNRNGDISGSLSINSSSPKYSRCVVFPTVNDYITIPLQHIGEFSYSVWFNRDRVSMAEREMLMTGWYGISFELNPNNTLSFLCSCFNSNNERIVRRVITITAFNQINTWYHVVFTHKDGIGSKIYINGVLDNTVSFTEEVNYSNTVATLGRYSSSTYNFLGKMSDFRVYASELSQQDVKDLYNTSAFIDNSGNLDCFDIVEESENLFSLDYFLEAANKSSTIRTFEYELMDNELSIPLNPAYFYYGADDNRTIFFRDRFIPNIQYKFDLWINADNVIYDGTNRPSGIVIRYSDNTTDSTSLVCTGNKTEPLGYQHKTLITDPQKSILGISVRYNVAQAAYYRWDSLIIPIMSSFKISKTGIINTGHIVDGEDIMTKIYKGDYIKTKQIIET